MAARREPQEQDGEVQRVLDRPAGADLGEVAMEVSRDETTPSKMNTKMKSTPPGTPVRPLHRHRGWFTAERLGRLRTLKTSRTA